MCECNEVFILESVYPDYKVHGVNMGPTWVLSAPDGPHVGSINFAIWVAFQVAGIQEWVGGEVGGMVWHNQLQTAMEVRSCIQFCCNLVQKITPL